MSKLTTKKRNTILAISYSVLSVIFIMTGIWGMMYLYFFTAFKTKEMIFSLLFIIMELAGMALFMYVFQYIDKRIAKAKMRKGH